VANQDVRTLVRDMYSAYEARDFSRVGDLIHDDVDWIIYGPKEVFPFVGPRQGKAAVLAALKDIATDYELNRYTPEITLVDGDRAAVMSDVSFTQKSSGRKLRFRLVNFLRFKDGRIVEFREFANTFDLVAQALGRELQV